eukprot:TRINITY_DN1725_c0_g1_i1.p1 TRINITY_DN1725_c0_g1~~TRINITY_DN1725_c0_g1_i1.p1  ORF type:complete len:123 (-),score=0.78 TRINITY_DN1725_c0_g1_i1:153-521(-)
MLSRDGLSVFGVPVSPSSLAFDTLLKEYNQRNETTVFNYQSVWKAGKNSKFTIHAKIRIPFNQMLMYRPSTTQMLKWGWLQFLGMFFIFWFLLTWFERFIFNNGIFETRIKYDCQPMYKRYT